MNRKTLIVAVALVAQVAAISWLIWRYERVVSQGTEVRFACQAYDPYDPLRGRYLRTRVSEDCTNMTFRVCETNRYEFHDKLFARLEPNGTNGLWRVAEVAVEPKAEGLWVRPKSSSIEYCLGWSDRGKNEEWDDFDKRKKASGLKGRRDLSRSALRQREARTRSREGATQAHRQVGGCGLSGPGRRNGDHGY